MRGLSDLEGFLNLKANICGHTAWSTSNSCEPFTLVHQILYIETFSDQQAFWMKFLLSFSQPSLLLLNYSEIRVEGCPCLTHAWKGCGMVILMQN